MKANQVIDKMVEIRDNNTLNTDQTKYVNQVIEDFTEMGSMFENDEDSMNQVKIFIAKFPSKPAGTPSRARGQATMVKLNDKLKARTQRNKPGANPRLDTSKYVAPKKKSVEIEGIILDKGDEVNDKSTGLTIVVDSFENRKEGLYILGSVKGTGQAVQVLRENAEAPKKSTPKKPVASENPSPVAKAKAEVAEAKAEEKKVVARAEKKAKELIKAAEKKAAEGKLAEAKKIAEKAKEVVQDAGEKAEDKTKEAEKTLEKAEEATETKAKKVKKAAEKKEKAIKKGTYLDFGKEVIRIETIQEKDGKKVITGITRTGKSVTKTCSVESCKITDFKNFNAQEVDFKGKEVAQFSEELRILQHYLDIMAKPTDGSCQSLLTRINKFAAEYKATNPNTKNPYRDEINDIASLLVRFLKKEKNSIESSATELMDNILDKLDGERIYKSVSIVKRFAGWAKRTVSAESIKEIMADIELSKKRKLIKPTDPLYNLVLEIEKILTSMQTGGAYEFPDRGLGNVSMGMAGTRKMIMQWSKDAENRAKAVINKSKSSAKTHKKGLFARIFGN